MKTDIKSNREINLMSGPFMSGTFMSGTFMSGPFMSGTFMSGPFMSGFAERTNLIIALITKYKID